MLHDIYIYFCSRFVSKVSLSDDYYQTLYPFEIIFLWDGYFVFIITHTLTDVRLVVPKVIFIIRPFCRITPSPQ